MAAALAAVAARAGADAIPQTPHGRALEYEADESITTEDWIFQPIAEGTERWQYNRQLEYKDVMAGSYVRLLKNLKVGAFYRLQYGDRHDDDWAQTPNGKWAWQNTVDRPESVAVLDVTPRFQLPFLPGRNWVLGLKTRYEYNAFDREETLKLEPELDYFWMNGLEPRATFILRYQTYLPLNWGQTAVYERWLYLAGLWHATSWLSIGPEVSLRDEIWTTSSQWASANPGSAYKVLYRAWAPGVFLAVRIP